MKVPFLDLQAQYHALKPEIDRAMQEVLDTSSYILGPAVEEFERAFASYCGTSHCIGLNSGTAALALLLQANDIGPGDEVILPANTFFATAEAVSEIGAIPVLVDCDVDTAQIDPHLAEAAITPRTKAIIAVHLYGQPADMDTLHTVAREHALLLFEDACQAHGALYHGKKTGSLGDGAAFSFYPGKNLGAYGDAGAVTTNDATVAERIRMLRDHGSRQKYHHECIGWNERMDGLQGAVLAVKLPHLDTWNAARRTHAHLYQELLPAGIRTFDPLPDTSSAHHLLVIRTPNRVALQQALKDADVATGIHYPVPIHLQPAFASRGWKKGDFPIAETLANEILSLPMYAELTEEQIRYVCETLATVLK